MGCYFVGVLQIITTMVILMKNIVIASVILLLFNSNIEKISF